MREERDALPQLLEVLDCPACRQGDGLTPQSSDGEGYLACRQCEFWYPIREEVPILLPPERNPSGFRRAVSGRANVALARRPVRRVDLKLGLYSYYSRVNEAIESFGLLRESLICDVGGSTGSMAALLGSEQTYVCFDLSFRSVSFGRKATGQFFCQADAERLPIRAGRGGFFVSREVLEHLNDPAAAARELVRAAPRGIVVVPTREFPFLYDPVNYVGQRLGRPPVKFGAYGYDHRQLFDIAAWRTLLEDAGLTVESERPVGSGACLNGSDVFFHAIWSWRDFDDLPRKALPVSAAHALFPLYRMVHGIDRHLLRAAVSRGFLLRATH